MMSEIKPLPVDHIPEFDGEAKKIWQSIESIAHTDPEDFRVVRHGTISIDLSDCIPEIKRLVAFYRRFGPEDVAACLPWANAAFSTATSEASRTLSRLRRLSATEQQTPLQTIRHAYYITQKELGPFVPESVRDDERLKGQLVRAEEVATQMEELETEADAVLNGMRKAAGKVGVMNYVETFQKAVTRHRESKGKWRELFAVLGVVTALVTAAMFLADSSVPSSIPEAIQNLGERLAVLGVLGYLLVWAGRGYRAAAHNQVVNEHRRDALTTFDAFVKAAEDPVTKEAVLLQTTYCIFSHRPSGFGQQENDSIPPTQMLELTRGVMGDKTVDR